MEHDAVILPHQVQTHGLIKGSCCLNRGDIANKYIFQIKCFMFFRNHLILDWIAYWQSNHNHVYTIRKEKRSPNPTLLASLAGKIGCSKPPDVKKAGLTASMSGKYVELQPL